MLVVITTRRMKISKSLWLVLIALFIFGVLTLSCGLVYDVLFAGIPFQDPPPDLAARYARHAHIARTIQMAGAILCMSSTGVAILIGLQRLVRAVWQKDRSG